MSIGHKPADIGLLEHCFDSLRVSAFGKPDAARIAAKALPVMIPGDHYLRAQGRRVIRHEREKGVSCGAGRYFEFSLLLKFAKGSNNVSAVGGVSVAYCREPVVIHPRQRVEGSIPMRAMNLFF